jgi:hypothetical protein
MIMNDEEAGVGKKIYFKILPHHSPGWYEEKLARIFCASPEARTGYLHNTSSSVTSAVASTITAFGINICYI